MLGDAWTYQQSWSTSTAARTGSACTSTRAGPEDARRRWSCVWPAMGVPGPVLPAAGRPQLGQAGLGRRRGRPARAPARARRARRGASRYGYADLAGDVGAVLDALKPRLDGRRVLLLGHSLGGQACALHLALHRRDAASTGWSWSRSACPGSAPTGRPRAGACSASPSGSPASSAGAAGLAGLGLRRPAGPRRDAGLGLHRAARPLPAAGRGRRRGGAAAGPHAGARDQRRRGTSTRRPPPSTICARKLPRRPSQRVHLAPRRPDRARPFHLGHGHRPDRDRAARVAALAIVSRPIADRAGLRLWPAAAGTLLP